jgi:hypothetical protein
MAVRPITSVLAALACAGTAATVLAGAPASASTSMSAGAAPADRAARTELSGAAYRAGPAYLPRRGDNADFPTWGLRHTRLCVGNQGWGSGQAKVQTRFGADPEWLPLVGRETKCVRRWWGGVPITVTNDGDSPLVVRTS